MTRENDDACSDVIPGRDEVARPEIHIIGCGVWIPGSRAYARAPE